MYITDIILIKIFQLECIWAKYKERAGKIIDLKRFLLTSSQKNQKRTKRKGKIILTPKTLL